MLNKLVVPVFAALCISASVAGYGDDVAEGKNYFFRHCLGCHAFTCNKEGPSLGGLFGRKAGSAEGFSGYSESLKNYDVVWTEETLDEFFKDPGGVAVGIMADIAKIDDAAQRQQLIAFLKTEDPSVNLCPE